MNALPFRELRFALRRLRKDLGSTLASVAALACGIGAAVATWSLVSAVLLNPLPVKEPERLFEVSGPLPSSMTEQWTPGHSYADLEAFRSSGAFEGIAAVGGRPLLVVERGDAPRTRDVHFASHDFFATLGIRAALGRTFAESDDRRGAAPVAVLSPRYWRSAFDADPNVLGRTVTVAGTTATIVGVLPRGFRGLHLSQAPDFYLPMHVASDMDRRQFYNRDPLGPGGYFWIAIVGRLWPGETPNAATARLNALDCLCPREVNRGEAAPITLTNVNVAAVPVLARAGTAQFATLLSTTVGLLLLIGCLTVGMLLLVRTEDRRDELAVRLALGATRGRLAAGIAIEAAILCALGALLAVPVAFWFLYGVRAFQLPASIDLGRLESSLAFGPWLAVTGSALAATIAIALVASLVGVVTAARSPVQSRALCTPRVTRRMPRTVLVASQVAITLVLVAGAGLFTRSLVEALTLNPAVATDRIVTAFVNLGQHGYTPERAGAFVDELLERLRQNGAIESASVKLLGSGGAAGFKMTIDGVEREVPASSSFEVVDPEFFSTIGLPITGGRGFDDSDTAGSPPVVIVSESFGRWIADGGNAIGRSLGPFYQGPSMTAVAEIIGVVPDLITEVGTTEPFVAYLPVAQSPPSVGAWLVLRAAADPRAAMREALAAAKALDARVTLSEMMTLDQRIAEQMNPQRFGIRVLGALGGIALLLTVLGTYVVSRSLVVRRRRELGIRAALGARSAQLRRLVLRDTARLVGIGLVAGLALAFAGARMIRSLLYQVEPLDPLVLVMTAAGIFVLALLVSLRPALEAARVDLTRSLREE
jgi:predicted permease